MKNNFFIKCNMIIHSELEFKKYGIEIKLPFYFHIADIKDDFLSENNTNELEFYGKDIYFQNENHMKISKYKKMLQYIDLFQLTLDNCDEKDDSIFSLTKEYRGGRIFKDIDSLYIFLVDILGFTEIDFSQINIFIKEQQIRLVNNFVKMLEEEIELGNGKKDPSESFMVLRCAYELNHSVIFPENIGKSISEFSFRELRTQRIYMAKKCEIEKIQYDEVMKDSKNKKPKGIGC